MFEDMTYEYILQRMLNKIPSSMDKREGSIIYDALAPAAVELAQLYMDLDLTLNETFADTASRQHLIMRAAERGIEPYRATYAVGKGEFDVSVPIGAKFSIDAYNWIVSEITDEENHIYKMNCETAGDEPNGYTGALIPVDYIKGLTRAELIEILIPGENEEPTEDFRKRYFDSLNSQAFGGNIQDYKKKVKAIEGIGGVKVYPVWNGGGTVRLVIINSEFKAPSSELIAQTQTAIDPVLNKGEGLGIAPIGHIVTVQGVTETTINITTNITYADGWSYEDVKTYIEEAIDAYFNELNASWENSGGLIVRISQIESRLLDAEGVVDIGGTALNGAENNLALGVDSIAKRGTVNA